MSALHVVTIDGPAGSGKSTVARLVADRLGYAYLDTGAMYRAVTATALERAVAIRDQDAIERFMQSIALTVEAGVNGPTVVAVDGDPLPDENLRTSEVVTCIGAIADHPAVRRVLAAAQRACGEAQAIVTEGRDQGTAVFPDAPHRFYLDASVAERAARRQRDYAAAGDDRELAAVTAEVERRDAEDRARPVGALTIPKGAVVIDTTAISAAQVADRIVAAVRAGAPSPE